MTLRAPFPWFGGKSRAAHLIWEAFGDVPNYVEPFAGSLAVLLGRPSAPRIETVNDRDAYLSNFWRAVAANPDEVAYWADWPVSECDLHARHRWLVAQEEFREKMKHDPDLFDPKIAGWWVWGLCQWIGSGWCSTPEWTTSPGRKVRGSDTAGTGRPSLSRNRGITMRGANTAEHEQRPDLSAERGLNARRIRDLTNAGNWAKRPALGRGLRGITRKLPNLQAGTGYGTGIANRNVPEQIPDLGGSAAGRGLHASGKRVVHLKTIKQDRGTASRLQTDAIVDWMLALAKRLRYVRVCCGDWSRVLGPSATEKIGLTGILLDPPYGAAADRDPSLYTHDDLSVAKDVREWAIANGENPLLRIALCGYEGEHTLPTSWRCVAWKAGNNDNASRERIWFSPHCLGARQIDLFSTLGAANA